MALVYAGIRCSICDLVVDLHQPYFATTHFIGDHTHPLWRYSDSVMHLQCFRTWPNRGEFAMLHNECFTPKGDLETISWHLKENGEFWQRHHPSGVLYPETTSLQDIATDQARRGRTTQS